jgi:hypothetical protein
MASLVDYLCNTRWEFGFFLFLASMGIALLRR